MCKKIHIDLDFTFMNVSDKMSIQNLQKSGYKNKRNESIVVILKKRLKKFQLSPLGEVTIKYNG